MNYFLSKASGLKTIGRFYRCLCFKNYIELFSMANRPCADEFTIQAYSALCSIHDCSSTGIASPLKRTQHGVVSVPQWKMSVSKRSNQMHALESINFGQIGIGIGMWHLVFFCKNEPDS